MATAMEPRPLADLEMDALVRVEREMERRAHGVRPWSIDDMLDQNAAEHARFEVARRARLGRVA
jgi:hypothetical protein